MAKIEHHAAYAFLIYYFVWILWKGTFIISGEYRYIVFLVVLFGILPDFDGIYWFAKQRSKPQIDTTEFQHHLYYWTHWPLSFSPLIILFVFSLIFNFYPEFTLVPVIGIYGGHYVFDSISCGDGLMWAKIPWRKGQYGRFINLLPDGSDGYHGVHWEARYRKTFIGRLGNIAVILSLAIISYFLIYTMIEYLSISESIGISGYYVMPIIFFIVMLYVSNKEVPKNLKEPKEGRYADYRINLKYINGLSEKNRRKHIVKYKTLLEERGIMEQLKLN